jgi:hypothetical protein
MRFEGEIGNRYRRSVEDALDAIFAVGNEEHRLVADMIARSQMTIRVRPVRKVRASGKTGLVSAGETNDRIDGGRLSIEEAFADIYITIAEETIDTGGQRGCEGTLVHEGRHALDFARTISSFSEADLNPLSIFDPTLYELEWAAHVTSGEYMLRVARDEYIDEGINLLILGKGLDGDCFLNHDGIRTRLHDNYGLMEAENPGPRASELLGLVPR